MQNTVALGSNPKLCAEGLIDKSAAAHRLIPIVEMLLLCRQPYAWQWLVCDALAAEPETLPVKVSAARRTVMGRFRNRKGLDGDECFALGTALQTLEQVVAERGGALKQYGVA